MKEDVKILRDKNWKNAALERDEWTQLLKKGQGPPRAVEPIIMMMVFKKGDKIVTVKLQCVFEGFRRGCYYV